MGGGDLLVLVAAHAAAAVVRVLQQFWQRPGAFQLHPGALQLGLADQPGPGPGSWSLHLSV